ncbi:MAG: hypothetical protein J6C95_03030 [Muribaculaceae bacterium]|nr:hypothetical protein [Muribaculaceae bacterium]
MEVQFDKDISVAVPDFEVLLVEADVVNGPTSDALWNEIEQACAAIRSRYALEDIRHRPAIDATRKAYKACGKEPNRYRPSAEALCRRAVKGLELYRSLAVIDLINLLSLVTGHSIGGFDTDKFVGSTLTLGIGQEGEPYLAIGRGELNIAGMPVYRDATGGVGTPTSDNDRTKLSPDTRRLTMTVNLYGEGEQSKEEVEALVRRLLTDYASASDIRTSYRRITP